MAAKKVIQNSDLARAINSYVPSSEEEEEYDWVYDCVEMEEKHLVMAGGSSHWWHYVLTRKKGDSEWNLWIGDKDGRKFQFGKQLVFNEDGTSVKMVDGDYELKEDECFYNTE